MSAWVRLLLIILVLFNDFYDGCKMAKTNELGDEEQKREIHERTIADTCIMLISSIVLLGGLIFVIWSKKVPVFIVLIVITIPHILRYLIYTVRAADSLKFIVSEKDNNRDFTTKEKVRFDVFVSGLLVIRNYIPISKFIPFLKEKTSSLFLCESLISLFVFVCAFLAFFVLAVELITPLRLLLKLCKWISAKIGGFSKQLSLLFWGKWDQPIIRARLTDWLFFKSKKRKIISWILFFIPILISFTIDLLINFILLAYYFVLCSCLGVFVEFCRMLGNGVLFFLNMIATIPGHKIFSNSFRMSGILAVFTVVITNRLEIFISLDDSFVAIIEFLASAIIIPVIFEWIYTYRADVNNKKESKQDN